MARKVLVTGASRGIGRAVAEKLLDGGHRVVGMARDFSGFPGERRQFRALEVDLADLSGLPERLRSFQAELDGIDAVVSCAGRGRFGHLEQFSYEQIRGLLDLNFLSHAYLARALLPGLKKRGEGDLVFMGSEAALAGKRQGAVYCASKFALRGFAQALREECAASGVRVTIVNPGMVRTGFFDDLDFAPGEEPANYVLPEDVAEVVAAVLSMRRETVVDEINLSPLKKVVRFRSEKEKT